MYNLGGEIFYDMEQYKLLQKSQKCRQAARNIYGGRMRPTGLGLKTPVLEVRY